MAACAVSWLTKPEWEQRLDPQCLGAANISGADVGQAEFPQR
jgi:hypothetical protein